jgi:hypothetical protein
MIETKIICCEIVVVLFYDRNKPGHNPQLESRGMPSRDSSRREGAVERTAILSRDIGTFFLFIY